ncbi:MAG: epoxyqueuosine reductase [Candidatus Bathyarchaeota archaeon]|nr:MAG: epoxyqueuosine reductase [Candidatus Bathyarchaeota archaeon]
MVGGIDDLGTWLEKIIKEFVNESPDNTLRNEANERAWDKPLVGFSSGADPLYDFFKEDIGLFFLKPLEWFEVTFPELEVQAGELTVISWILPQTETTKAEHRLPREMPTERWARARVHGEEFNDKLRRHVVEELEDAGYQAVAPMLSPHWRRETSERYGYASSWSERHAAYVAGLGTFGLCDGLITPKGKAMRTGSVIARVNMLPSKRTYDDPHAYCLWYAKGTCKECVARCPVGAISEDGHDKERCRTYLQATRRYVEEAFKFKGYGCGLCQTGVACESRIQPEIYQ